MEATKTCFVINYIKSSKDMGHVQELEGIYHGIYHEYPHDQKDNYMGLSENMVYSQL